MAEASKKLVYNFRSSHASTIHTTRYHKQLAILDNRPGVQGPRLSGELFWGWLSDTGSEAGKVSSRASSNS